MKKNGTPDLKDLAHLDPGERITPIPSWIRLAAWSFLALWFTGGMVLMGFYLGKRRGIP